MFKEIIKTTGFWSILGVIVGALLSEGIRFFHKKWRIFKLKELIIKELESILTQIPSKLDIANKILTAIKSKQVLPANSVKSINIGYHNYMSEIYKYLSKNERNCLYVIYERLKIADEELNKYEQNIMNSLKAKVMDKPFDVFQKRIIDIIEAYQNTERLIKSYLDKNPIDVFNLTEKKYL